MFYLAIRIILTLIVVNIILFPFSQLALTQEDSDLLRPPDTGTPDERTSPGGSRTEPDKIIVCQNKEISIIPLTGNQTKEYTVSEYPSFWFYIANEIDAIEYLEFLLEDSETKEIIYQTEVQISPTAGIIEVALPQQSQNSLKLNKNYAWYLRGYCSADFRDKPDITLSGWVQPIPLNSQLQNQLELSDSQKYDVYLENEIMYDAITTLAKQYRTEPENPELNNAWTNLLDILGLEELAEENFVN